MYISINTGLYASDTKTFLGDYNAEKDGSFIIYAIPL